MNDNAPRFMFDKNGKRMFDYADNYNHALLVGEWNAKCNRYVFDDIVKLLNSDNVTDIFVAFGAIRSTKTKKAIPYLQKLAYYDEDINIQHEAIITIHSIGGSESTVVMKELMNTEHKDFIQNILGVR